MIFKSDPSQTVEYLNSKSQIITTGGILNGRKLSIVTVFILLLGCGCGSRSEDQAARMDASHSLVVVEARPDRGFRYPYVLRIPRNLRAGERSFLLVEPNNTGTVSDDFNVHLETAKSYLDFFDHAKYYLKQNKKMEASVIASSVFEDTIRKVGRKNALEFPKLDRLIDELKKDDIISLTEMKKYKYYAGIRNEALHANWDNIALDDVNDLIHGDFKHLLLLLCDKAKLSDH
jgi:hypothetical protein